MRVFIVLLCFVAQVVAFAPLLSTRHAVIVGSSATKTLASKKSDAEWSAAILSRENNNRLVVAAGFLSGAASLIPSALADTELEMADLPPPWIPVVFGLGLLVVSLST